MIPSVVFERYRRSLSPDGECLVSSYSTGSHGYTQIGWSESGQATMVLGHRVAWEMHFGPIPDGMTIDHICRNRRCGRIDHLRLMTNEENARMNGNAIKTRPREVWMVRGRNIQFGVWTGESWIGIREKFGSLFLDDCEVPGHTCFPVRYVDRLPDEIQMRCTFDAVCQHCDEPVDFDRERETRWQHTSAIDCGHRVMPIAKRYQPLFDYLTRIEETHEWSPT